MDTKRWLKERLVLRRARALNSRLRAWNGAVPRWDKILTAADRQVMRALPREPRVLLATGVGGHFAVNTMDGLLAAALLQRSAAVEVLLCDRALPACMSCESSWFPDGEHFVRYGPSRSLCGACFGNGQFHWSRLGLPLLRYGDWICSEDRSAARQQAYDTSMKEVEEAVDRDIHVGRHARAGVLRYFARGTISEEPIGEAVFRRYLEAAILAARAFDRLLNERTYDVVVLHHGIYVPQGVAVEVARKIGTRVVTWATAYRSRSFIFSHHDTYHLTMLQEPESCWNALAWTPELAAATDAYMEERFSGRSDWITYQDRATAGAPGVASALGLDPQKPIISLFTNVFWDAQITYPSNCFPDMRAWLLWTIQWFATRPDLQLVVRIHPAEIKNPLQSRQMMADEITRHFSELPGNVRVIGPENGLNSYDLGRASQAAIIYATKMGIELVYMGIPTVVAGEAWIRNKGLTLDAATLDEYRSILESLPDVPRLDRRQRERAEQYAFHFFFRRMIPLDCIEPRPGWPPFRVTAKTIADLAPGASKGLDIICEGITKGTPFIFPAEKLMRPREDGSGLASVATF